MGKGEVRGGGGGGGFWGGGGGGGGYGADNEPLDGEGELVASRHALRDDVLIFHSGRCEALPDAGDERVDDAGVPPRVHYGDAQRGA